MVHKPKGKKHLKDEGFSDSVSESEEEDGSSPEDDGDDSQSDVDGDFDKAVSQVRSIIILNRI